jgi:hypothetical protein
MNENEAAWQCVENVAMTLSNMRVFFYTYIFAYNAIIEVLISLV